MKYGFSLEELKKDVACYSLQHYLENNREVYQLPPEALDLIKHLLADKKTTSKVLEDCIGRIKEFVARREKQNEHYAEHMEQMREEGRII